MEVVICLFCVELVKESMTSKEVARAWREFAVSDHTAYILSLIDEHYDSDDIAKELNELYIEERSK